MTFLGVSVTAQCPQGSVSGQFDVPVGQCISELVELPPEGSENFELPENLAALMIQSDFPCDLLFEYGTFSLEGTHKRGMPLVAIGSLQNCDFVGGKTLTLSNPGEKNVIVRILSSREA